MSRAIFFFVGTEAELIKLFPVIIECRNRGLQYYIIASGQNDITKSRIILETKCGEIALELSKEANIKKSAVGLLTWWVKTYQRAENKIKQRFAEVQFQEAYMVVHGDTVSTYMGARIGKKLGMKVCHVEAGLRSHNILNPFPEEIDRMLTSRIARIHFAPGEYAVANLAKAKGRIVNTKQNTLLDSLEYSKEMSLKSDIESILSTDYFVFVMHRQENLANRSLVENVFEKIEKLSKEKKCVIILHEITKNTLEKFGIMQSLEVNPNIKMLPRMDYFDFMKLLQNAQFVITDGGSNQEELYYMGKPALILRKTTERQEGIGINARLYDGDIAEIERFAQKYGEMQIQKLEKVSPSRMIVDVLVE